MPAPFQHSGLSTLMGSWPVIPSYISGTASFDPRVLEEHAVILGVKRETSAGFNVAGKTMYLWIDGQLVTFRKSINFNSYSDPYTLDEVIAEINADALTTVAYNDNGFLRLQSPNSGQQGYLKLGTFNDPDVFHELGLFSGTEVYGGQLKQAKNIDPDRQVALPGQFAISDGESFTADVINRAIHQLAVNTDRAEGLLGRKRLAKQEESVFSSYTPTGTPDEEGVSILGNTTVYTGDTQSQAALDRLFVVLDQDGKEYVKKVTTVYTTDTVTFTNADGRQIATDTGGNFNSGDEKNEVFVRSSDGTLPAALQDVPMKILEVQSANVAVIQPIDPATGDVVLFTTAGVSADRILYKDQRCRVDQVRESQSGSRVEGVLEQVSPLPSGAHTPTRIDLNNRIVVSGATFLSDGVQVGDRVGWSFHGATNPYSNDGVYRVSEVIDEETIEVVSEDWGPAFLNPDLSSPGGIAITTDGLFYTNPFLRFLPEASGGAIPEAGDYIKVVYLELTDFRTVTDDPASLIGGGVSFVHEADDLVQKAILSIIGPSADSISDYLHDDARNSMENIDYRLDFEHYPSDTLDAGTGDAAREGRHKDIRPDTIDMWEGITGETVTIRGASGETSQEKLAVRDSADNVKFSVAADGTVVTYAALLAAYDSSANASVVELQAESDDEAKVTIAAKSATGVAQLKMFANEQGTPLRYAIDVDAADGRMNFSVDNDGSGGSVADFLQFDNDGTITVTTEFNASQVRALNQQGLSLQGGVQTGAGLPGTSVLVQGGYAEGSGSDKLGGLVTVEGGQARGSGYSYVDLKAATAGASGSAARNAERYMLIDGQTGTVIVSKRLVVQDSGFYLDWDGTDPFIYFDTNDYLQYDRNGGVNSNGRYGFLVNSAEQFSVEEEHVTVKAAAALTMEPRTTSGLAVGGTGYAIFHSATERLQLYHNPPTTGGSGRWEYPIHQTFEIDYSSSQSGSVSPTLNVFTPNGVIYGSTVRAGTTVRVKFSGRIITSTGLMNFKVYLDGTGTGTATGVTFDGVSAATGDFAGEAYFTFRGSGTGVDYGKGGWWSQSNGTSDADAGVSNPTVNTTFPIFVRAAFEASSAACNLALDTFFVEIAG